MGIPCVGFCPETTYLVIGFGFVTPEAHSKHSLKKTIKRKKKTKNTTNKTYKEIFVAKWGLDVAERTIPGSSSEPHFQAFVVLKCMHLSVLVFHLGLSIIIA
jgi:hypothetical protein